MNTHNNRNASNIRNESNNRNANTIWTPANAGMLAKVVRPATAFRETNYSRDTVQIRDDSIGRDNRNIMDVISSMTARTDSRKVSNSREDSNIQHGSVLIWQFWIQILIRTGMRIRVQEHGS
jgi:hypothetical protein